MRSALHLLRRCQERGWTIATAESVTAGGIAAALAEHPGCSAVLRGGVVAYSADVKRGILGVDPDLLSHVVSAPVAAAMAQGVRDLVGADIAIATTGVAGPQGLDDQPPGTVWCGAITPDGAVHTTCWHLPGDRLAVQRGAIDHALAWVEEILD
jgi:nicotinamide-nucleotide amidase